MIVQRLRSRLFDYQVCPEEESQRFHDASRVLYYGSLVASLFVTGPVGAAAMMATLPLNAVYGSAQNQLDYVRSKSGARVAGFEEPPRDSDVIFAMVEQVMPILLFT